MLQHFQTYPTMETLDTDALLAGWGSFRAVGIRSLRVRGMLELFTGRLQVARLKALTRERRLLDKAISSTKVGAQNSDDPFAQDRKELFLRLREPLFQPNLPKPGRNSDPSVN